MSEAKSDLIPLLDLRLEKWKDRIRKASKQLKQNKYRLDDNSYFLLKEKLITLIQWKNELKEDLKKAQI